MRKIKVLTVFGTRPEAVKMAPLVKELAKQPGIDARVAVTAQHREMLDQVLELFSIKPDYDLNIMTKEQGLEEILYKAMKGLGEILASFAPRLVLVHGDTATTLAGALAAYYRQIDIGHVEAGLRTGDKYKPFPEEMNRRLTGALVDYHFAPTPEAAKNLEGENIAKSRIIVTGNTVIDALLQTIERPFSFEASPLRAIDFEEGPTILLTAHRRENWGEPLKKIAKGVLALVQDLTNLQVIFPVHKNETVRQIVHPILGGHPRIHLIEPLDYLSFCHLMKKVTLILTDSGGIQEEGPALGKPVLVLREKTERPEALEAGTVRLVGCEEKRIYELVVRLLKDGDYYDSMAKAKNPYGDGLASQRIVQYINGIYC